MRTLEFKVDKQDLRKQPGCDFSGIVAKSVGYLHAKFHFSEEWDGCRKVASFWHDDGEYPVLLDENDMCVIPAEALTGKSFLVSATGGKDNGF